MPDVERYYNEFYEELCRVDAAASNYSRVAALLEQEISSARPARIADLGCGYGTVSSDLAANGHLVYGVDLGDRALRSLHGQHIRAIKSDIRQRLPIADASVDVVLLLDVLEHVFNPLAVLAEARRILRDNGVVIITTPLYFDVLDRIRVLFTGSIISYDNLAYGKDLAGRFRSYNYDHVRFFRPRDINEMLAAAGFTLERRVFLPIPSPGLMRVLGGALKFLAQRMPNLFAHSVKARARKT